MPTLNDFLEPFNRKLQSGERGHWVREVIEPLGRALHAHMPGYQVDVFGPQGIGATATVWFEKEGVEGDAFDIPDGVKVLQFRPRIEGEGETRRLRLLMVDRSEEMMKFPEGSLGANSGLNYPSVPLDSATELTELLKRIQ